jgi:hypothetical protein
MQLKVIWHVSRIKMFPKMENLPSHKMGFKTYPMIKICKFDEKSGLFEYLRVGSERSSMPDLIFSNSSELG